MQQQIIPAHPKALPPPLLSAQPNLIDVGHSKVAHREVGSGPDLLFVHGWPLSGLTYRKVVPKLATDYRCHVIDLPGGGDSEFDKEAPIDFMTHIESLKTVVRHLALKDYVIVGHDSGGLISRYLAASDPEVRGLVLAGTEVPGHMPFLVTALTKMSKLPGAEGTLRMALRSAAFRRSALGFGGCFRDRRLIEQDFFELMVKPIIESDLHTWGAMELLRTYDHASVDGLTEVHAQLQMPIQLIWGENDPFFPLELAKKMQTQLDDAELHVINGGKLFVHEEFAGEFAGVMSAFLARLN